MIQIHIRTQHGKFMWPISPVHADYLDRIVERCCRAISEGSVGPLTDWTVGNHGQVNAPAKGTRGTKTEILECYTIWP